MKIRTVVVIAFVNFILSSTILQLFRINDAVPNFCIILSIVIATLSTPKNAFVFAFTSGLLQDVFLGRMLGVNFLIYGLLVFGAIKIIDIMFKGNFITPIVLMGMGTLFYHIVFYVIMFFFQSTIPLNLMLSKIIMETLMNSLIGYFIYAIIFNRVNGYKLGDFNA
ncbi:MAG: rod shape-determining protein MreD [Firmicutes bacterium]|nr:rod shape-determining protein MreD [Bacillota bacterium]